MDHIPAIPAPVPNFSSLARDALSYLHENVGLGTWMVTRVTGKHWIVLDAEDKAYGVEPRSTFQWTDSFCSQMVLGNGPRIAPCAADVPAYAAAPIGKQMTIGAYIGVPLVTHDGSLFGTLCAIDPQPQPESVRASLPLVELIATMLSGVLSAEIRATEWTRRAEQSQIDSEIDSLTGLFNRRGWDRLIAIEEARCRRYGHPSCVIAMDLDDLKRVNDSIGHVAGDKLIARAGAILKAAIRSSDIAARLGGDEFSVLGVECDAADAEATLKRIRVLLEQGGVNASLGISKGVAATSLQETAAQADRLMYEEKNRRKSSRLPISLAS